MKYTAVVPLLVKCSGCGCLVSDTTIHEGWHTSSVIPVPPVVVPPVVPAPTGSLQELINDITLPNEGHPHGIPSGYSFYNQGELDNPLPPGNFSAVTLWGVIFEDSNGSSAVNVRLAVKNPELWLWVKSQSKWVLYQSGPIGGYNGYEPGVDSTSPFANQSIPTSFRTEADGSTSVAPVDGFWFHFWCKDRSSINAADIGGCFTKYQARIVMDDPSQVDERAKARYLASAGADWWQSMSALWPQNSQVYYDRFVYLNSSWRSIYGCSWTPAAIKANPPPV